MSRTHRVLIGLSITTLLLTSFTVFREHPIPANQPIEPNLLFSITRGLASGHAAQVSRPEPKSQPAPTAPLASSLEAQPSAIDFEEAPGTASTKSSSADLAGAPNAASGQPAAIDLNQTSERSSAPVSPPRAADSAPNAAVADSSASPEQTQFAVEQAVELASRIPIIEYHYSTFYFDGVGMQTEWFVEQLEWLAANGYRTLSINELADFIDGTSAPPQRSVALTFDVGISHFDDYAQVVVPTLRRLGLHGIFFIQPGGVRDECDGSYTCWPTLVEWLAEGVISVGSHTITHRDFAALSPAEIAYELRGSQEIIQRELGVKVIGVCYPFDSINPEAFAILESLGYRFAVAGYSRSDRSAHFGDSQPYALPRYYPYSNPAIYPAISGADGQTFPQLIEGAVAD